MARYEPAAERKYFLPPETQDFGEALETAIIAVGSVLREIPTSRDR